MKKRYVISLIVIFLLLLVVSGVSYAYFSATVNNNGTTSTVTAGTMAIEFSDGPTVSLENAIPGSSVTKTFKVKNTGNIATTYNISLTDLENTFVDKTDLVYTLTSTTGANKGSTQIPSASSYIIINQAIGVGVTQEYTLTITFKETNDNQDNNQNKSFKGTISVTSEQIVTTPSAPELYQGMIPVTYDASGNTIVADTTGKWYDYLSHNWANAVLVNCADTTIKDKYFNSDMSIKSSVVGTTMSMDEILQMYVWIPRYKYLLWDFAGGVDEHVITIVFEDKNTTKSTGSTSGTYLTHPAFTFGDTELNGMWVGKFETSGTTTNLTIKPNVQSLSNVALGGMFNASRNQDLTYSSNYGMDSSTIDTHMMKNMEWGAVAYLVNSIYGRYNDTLTCIASGCEVWVNNVNTGYGNLTAVDGVPLSGQSITGCGGPKVSARWSNLQTACASGYDWTALGVNASTTGNQYGIYDMSGGAYEAIMGNMVDSNGNFYPEDSGLTQPDTKYYDSYAYSTNVYEYDFRRGKLGDATKEVLMPFEYYGSAWYYDRTDNFIDAHWIFRGQSYQGGDDAGIFSISPYAGESVSCFTFRSVLSAQ